MKFEREDEQSAKKAELIRKVVEYLEHPVFVKRLSHISRPKEGTSITEWEGTYKAIKSCLTQGAKEVFVENAILTIGRFTENACVSILQLEHMKGSTQRVFEEDRDGFKEDMTILAIEMSDQYMPGPELRIFGRLLAGFGREFSNAQASAQAPK